jgi:uncharacterized protein YlxP (DUF503 family)
MDWSGSMKEKKILVQGLITPKRKKVSLSIPDSVFKKIKGKEVQWMIYTLVDVDDKGIVFG